MGNYDGTDNYGQPRAAYVAKVAAFSAAELFAETKQKIWLAAYAQNNPRSDYHWHVDACYAEFLRRDDRAGYAAAFAEVQAER